MMIQFQPSCIHGICCVSIPASLQQYINTAVLSTFLCKCMLMRLCACRDPAARQKALDSAAVQPKASPHNTDIQAQVAESLSPPLFVSKLPPPALKQAAVNNTTDDMRQPGQAASKQLRLASAQLQPASVQLHSAPQEASESQAMTQMLASRPGSEALHSDAAATDDVTKQAMFTAMRRAGYHQAPKQLARKPAEDAFEQLQGSAESQAMHGKARQVMHSAMKRAGYFHAHKRRTKHASPGSLLSEVRHVL